MSTTPPDSTSPDMLSGWREIATYLGKGIRTTQRWHKEYDLPVRRLLQEGGETVVASRAEIDQWLNQNSRFTEARWPETPAGQAPDHEQFLTLTEEAADSVDDRIARLGSVRRDLEAALAAVDELRQQARTHQHDADLLRREVQGLREDRRVAETLLAVPEDSFARLIGRATSRSRWRGKIEGLLIGFISGCLSSLLIWYLTSR